MDTEQKLIAKMMLSGRHRREGAVVYRPWIQRRGRMGGYHGQSELWGWGCSAQPLCSRIIGDWAMASSYNGALEESSYQEQQMRRRELERLRNQPVKASTARRLPTLTAYSVQHAIITKLAFQGHKIHFLN